MTLGVIMSSGVSPSNDDALGARPSTKSYAFIVVFALSPFVSVGSILGTCFLP